MNTDNNRFEYHHQVTFGDTNVVGNVYFANFFVWQGKAREALLAQIYPEFVQDLRQGFGLITEYAHQDFFHEALLFDQLRIRVNCLSLTRTRIEFEFEFRRAGEEKLLCKGRQAVVWTNQQHRPSVMPDKLYEETASYYALCPTSL